MSDYELLRLAHVEVSGLFGIYSHSIGLNLDNRTTLLHGANGVGKTVILRMIDALIHDRLEYFRTIPFSQINLGFHDGSLLTFESSDCGTDKKYRLQLTGRGEREISTIDWDRRPTSIAAQIEYLVPHEKMPDVWVDIRDNEILSGEEVFNKYGPMISWPIQNQMTQRLGWFKLFLRNTKAHLIEAQRLVQLDWQSSANSIVYPWRYRKPSVISTVNDCRMDFQKRLGETMARYGRRSQALDQSFPQRLISATKELTVSELQKKMVNLDTITEELKNMRILDDAPSHPFNVRKLGNLDKTQSRVMTLYVSDTANKLQALDDLANRTRVFLNNVNQKYRHKRIRLDRKEGFIAESDSGTMLRLESLSSGEQQELLLNYDLLFRVASNTIVLIDEPELSLHVAWQKRFLPDLLKIIQLSNFDALIATHSPFIVGDSTDLMVGLEDEH